MVQKKRPTQVLLVEDSPGDAWLIRDILSEGSIPKDIHLVTNGERALRFLRRVAEYADAPRPDLVLLDVNLPGRNGLDVLREIKGDPALRTITVVVLTTSDSIADVNEAYNLNANCYVVKPVDLGLFTEAVRGIEEFWLRTAMLPGEGIRRYWLSSAQNANSAGNGPSARVSLRRHYAARVSRRQIRAAARRMRGVPSISRRQA